jgi:hypothetical protein
MSKILTFTLLTYTGSELTIKVTNDSGAALKEGVTIELYPLKFLLDQRIKDKSREAATSQHPAGAASLAGIVTGAAGWSVWAKAETSDTIVPIMLLNDKDQAGEDIPAVPLAPGAEFIIKVALNSQASRARIDLDYSYEYGIDDVYKRVDGKLELKPADADEWVPQVSLTTSISPTMIPPKTDVTISWAIKDGVSATLRGPLPGGNSEWTLSNSPTSKFKIEKGSFNVKAVGPMTYILDAQVKRPDGKPNLQVIKMLSLDVHTREKYGYVIARPRRVLSYGLVELDWAAWGVNDVIIDAGGAARKIPLTDITLSGFRQGSGVMRITAGRPEGKDPLETTVDLNVEIDQKLHTESETKFRVIPWRKMDQSEFTGRPLGLAVPAEQMALLTTDGLWIANVGKDDFTPTSYDQVTKVSFTNTTSAQKPKAWLALAALNKKFVVVRQTSDNDVQVALYTAEGKPDEIPPLDLPPELRLFMEAPPTVDVVGYGNRAYIVVEQRFRAGLVRRAYSVGFDSAAKKAEFRPENLLESLTDYRLMTFDDALYALNRNSGHVIRFELTTAGKLEPYKAASAVTDQGASMIKDGLFVPVGRVFAVLSPTSVPSLSSLNEVGLRNVLRYQNLTPLKAPNAIQQDIVYGTQNNRWSRCGHGLDAKVGVAAFRGGDSERLWFIEPNKDTYTLTVSTEHLFLHDFVTDLPAKPLPRILDKTREFSIVNDTPLQFVPMNDTCAKAGVSPFSGTGPVELTPLPTILRPGVEEKFQIRYNEAEPAVTTLRFLTQRPAGTKNEYYLEVTLSGPDLANATTVFKRIKVDRYGVLSILEVPGTRQEHSTIRNIGFTAKALVNGMKLRIRNESPFWLWVRSPEAPNPDDREKFYEQNQGQVITIKYNTPALSIYAHGGGELPIDVDFAMPMGLEAIPGETQNKSVRINTDKAVAGFVIESISSPATDEDPYECTMRYRLERKLEAAYMGDGAPSRDGSSFYLPIAIPTFATSGQVLKINANDLSTMASASVEARSVFTAPNSLAVLADSVLAVLKNCEVNIFDLSLRLIKKVNLSQYDLITNLKGGHNETKFFTVGMKQLSANPPRYSYSFAAARTSAPTSSDMEMGMDAQSGFVAKPVPGAPSWVSPSTIPLMDVNFGAVALCVEGGLLLIDMRTKRLMATKIEGVVRQEAVLIDPVSNVVYFAHSNATNNELSVSRINPGVPTERMETMKLPFPLTHVVTDKDPPAGTKLEYHRPRAVSMAMTERELFVSHATKISVLDKKRLTVLRTVSLGMPCRLIQVRRGVLPATPTPEGHVGPRECNLVWAIGSIYIGNGIELKNQTYRLYKLAIV